jgi:hypothetical protein
MASLIGRQSVCGALPGVPLAALRLAPPLAMLRRLLRGLFWRGMPRRGGAVNGPLSIPEPWRRLVAGLIGHCISADRHGGAAVATLSGGGMGAGGSLGGHGGGRRGNNFASGRVGHVLRSPVRGGRSIARGGASSASIASTTGIPGLCAACPGGLGDGRVEKRDGNLPNCLVYLPILQSKIGRLAGFRRICGNQVSLHQMVSVSSPSKKIIGGAPSSATLCQNAFIKK